MARKVCPECKAVTGASSKTCKRCGHTFDAVALAEPSRVRRCAMCGLTNLASTTKCQCGFDFDEAPEDLRAFYKSRRMNAWVLLFGAVTLGLVGCLISMFLLGLMPLGIVGLVATLGAAATACRKALRILGATRTNLDELAEFPHARVVQLPTTASRSPSAPADTRDAAD